MCKFTLVTIKTGVIRDLVSFLSGSGFIFLKYFFQMHNINSYWYQEYTSLFDFTITCDGYNSFLPGFRCSFTEKVNYFWGITSIFSFLGSTKLSLHDSQFKNNSYFSLGLGCSPSFHIRDNISEPRAEKTVWCFSFLFAGLSSLSSYTDLIILNFCTFYLSIYNNNSICLCVCVCMTANNKKHNQSVSSSVLFI